MTKISATLFATLITFSFYAIKSHAHEWDPVTIQPWRLVLSLGGGASIAHGIGASGTFPIQNPSTEESYIYTINGASDTEALLDVYLAAEFEVQHGLAMQLGIDYNQPTVYPATGSFIQGADVSSQNIYTYQYKINVKQLLCQAKVIVLGNDDQTYHPYILGGVGVSQNNAYSFSTNVPPTETFTRQYQAQTTHSLGYGVGGGIDFDIHPQVRLGIGYRYTGLGTISLGQATIDTTQVSGSLSQSNFNTNQLLGELTFIF